MIYHSTASVFLQSSSFIPTPKPRWMLLFFTSPSESGLFCIPVIMHYGKCICKIQTPLSVDLFSRHPPWQCALVCIMLISDQSDLCYICSFSFKPFYLLKIFFYVHMSQYWMLKFHRFYSQCPQGPNYIMTHCFSMVQCHNRGSIFLFSRLSPDICMLHVASFFFYRII